MGRWSSRSLSVCLQLARATGPFLTDAASGQLRRAGSDCLFRVSRSPASRIFSGRDGSHVLSKIGFRCFASSALSEEEYHDMADTCIDELHEDIEVFLEDAGAEPYDVDYGQGVLTVNLGPKGTFVINKQTPNRQIWLSSPVSGPFRYDPVDGQWVYSRDRHTLHDKVKHELGHLVGHEFKL